MMGLRWEDRAGGDETGAVKDSGFAGVHHYAGGIKRPAKEVPVSK